MTASTLVPAAGHTGDPRRPHRGRRLLTRLVGVVAPCAALAWGAANWPSIRAGSSLIASGQGTWFALAFLAAGLTWIAGAVCQQGAVLLRLPRAPLVATQLAGSAANHVLPSGIGVAAVNTRFLERRGLTRAEAVRAVALNAAAGGCVHLVITGLLLAAGASTPAVPTSRTYLLVAAAVIGVGTVALVALRRRLIPLLLAQAGLVIAAWTDVFRRPVRSLQLWAGSAAVPVLHAITLLMVLRAIGCQLAVGSVFIGYFVASAASATIPSPGGFGALDATLTLVLVSAGLRAPTAVAAVIAYRVITVWLPLLPSAATIVLLRRRRII